MRREPKRPRRKGGAVATRIVRVVEVEVRRIDQLTRRAWDRAHALGLSLDDIRDRTGLENPSVLLNAEKLSESSFSRLDAALEHPDWDAPLPPTPDPSAALARRLSAQRALLARWGKTKK